MKQPLLFYAAFTWVLCLTLLPGKISAQQDSIFYVKESTFFRVKESDTLFVNGSFYAAGDFFASNEGILVLTDSLFSADTNLFFESSIKGYANVEPPPEKDINDDDPFGYGAVCFISKKDSQRIVSVKPIIFNNINIGNPHTVVLTSDQNILNTVSFEEGPLDLNGHILRFYYDKMSYERYSGLLGNETNTNRIIDSSKDLGYLDYKKNLYSGKLTSVGNSGFSINDFGKLEAQIQRFNYSDPLVTEGSLPAVFKFINLEGKYSRESIITYLEGYGYPYDTLSESRLAIWQKLEEDTIYYPVSSSRVDEGANTVSGGFNLVSNSIATLGTIDCFDNPHIELSDSFACVGSPFTLEPVKDESIDPTTYIYSWTTSMGDTILSDNEVAEPHFTPTSAMVDSTIKFYLYARDKRGCRTLDTAHITIHSGKPLHFEYLREDGTKPGYSICEGETLTIRDTIDFDAADMNYTWTFVDETIEKTSGEVSRLFDDPGNPEFFTVSYTNEYGCITTVNRPVIVMPTPEPEFSAPWGICEGSPLTLTNNSSIFEFPDSTTDPYIGEYIWQIENFDTILVDSKEKKASGGNTFSSPLVSVENTNPNLGFTPVTTGWHTITLRATSGSACVSTISDSIYVNPSVTADWQVSSENEVCFRQQSLFTVGEGSSQGPEISYTWTFDDVATDPVTDTTYLYTFRRQGNHNVILEVQSDSGCTALAEHTIEIFPLITADFEVEDICVNSMAQFINHSVGADDYTWDYGDGSTDVRFEHEYTTAGTYDVKLVATNSNNCNDSITKEIEVFSLPHVEFTANSEEFCLNDQENLFTNLSQTGLDSLRWNFGDGTFSNMVNPDKRYTIAGSHYVSLLGIDANNCRSSFRDTVYARPVERAYFTANRASVCEGEPSLFRSDSSHTGELEFIFGNGNSTTAPSDINYTYPLPGAFNASMIVHSINGCTDTASATVTISPTPDIEIATEAIVCLGELAAFSPSPASDISNIRKYNWQFGDTHNPVHNTSTSKDPEHEYTTEDSYTIQLEVESQNGCTNQTVATIDVVAPPPLPFGPEESDCMDEYTLTAGVPSLEYLWSDGSTGNTLLVTEDGTYSVQITDPLTGCRVSQSTFVDLLADVIPGLGSDRSVCDSTVLDAHNNGSEYLWSTGETSRTIQVTESGDYSVNVIHSNGCEGSETVHIDVYSSPVIDLEESTKVCQGEIVLLDAGVVTDTYEWNTGATSQSITVNSPGFYWVRAENTLGCSDYASTNVSIFPTPIVYLGKDRELCEETPLKLSAGNPEATYLWSTGESTQTIEPATSGTYSVAVTNRHGCSAENSVNILFNSLPAINLGGNQSLCEGNALLLNAGNPGAVYLWSTGANSPEIEINDEGEYWVRVTDGNGCTSLSEVVAVEYRINPRAPFNSGSIEACGNIVLNAENPGSEYLWQDGTTGSRFYTTESGTYEVAITNPEGCTITDNITVNVKPVATVYLPEMTNTCANATIQLDAGEFGPEYSYRWNTGATTPQIDVSTQGTYKLEVIHEEGCIGVDSTFVLVNPVPEVDLGNEYLLCRNSGLTLDAGNPGAFYVWESSNGYYAASQQIAVPDSGRYWVYVIDENGCSATDTVDVLYTSQSIEPFFMVASDIQVGDTVTFVDLSVPEPDFYYWNFGDLSVSEKKKPSHIYTAQGDFAAQLIVSNGVCDATITKNVHVEGYNPYYLAKMRRELEEQKLQGLIAITYSNVFPNPTSGEVTIEMTVSEKTTIGIYLFSINGQLMKMERVHNVDELEHTLDLSAFREGMYILRLVTVNEGITHKIIKIY